MISSTSQRTEALLYALSSNETVATPSRDHAHGCKLLLEVSAHFFDVTLPSTWSMRQLRDDDYSRIVSRFDEIPEVVHRNARMQQLRIDQPAKPAHASCQAHLVQVDCTRKQVAYQMFSSASHLTEIYRVLKITAGKWDNCPAAVKQTSTRCCRDKVNPNESTRDANEKEQTTLVSLLNNRIAKWRG